MISNYMKYRGKCKEFSEQAIKDDPSLTLVRGYYICPLNGKEQHWWTKDKEGNIFDPTKLQFPSAGTGEYVEFNGYYDCTECGDSVHEDVVISDGPHTFCSGACFSRCVGL